MELHPILERSLAPKEGLWYVLSAMGECPSVRVGHTCTHVRGQGNSNGKVYIIGGANPSGAFAETYVLDLDSFSWDISEAPGFKPRYEHAAFIPESKPGHIYVFGGADQSGNNNDVQVFDTCANSWSTPSVGGTAPSPRTYHTNAATGDLLYVYSGGQSGADPVGDRQLHSLDASTHTWSVVNVKGDSPKPRHGHVVLAVGGKLYVHGGMAGSTFYDDLHVLDLQKLTWRHVKQKRGQPSARAAHSGVVVGTGVYIFGGMGRTGALDDCYMLDTESLKWTRVDLEGPPPASRLDFGMCTVQMCFHGDSQETAEDVAASGRQARDLLEQELRLGSAGSGRSVCSAGSVHSLGEHGTRLSSAGSTQSAAEGNSSTPPQEPKTSPHKTADHEAKSDPNSEGCSPGGATSVSANGAVAQPAIPLCLVLGGMDTEGEIFDDCLVLALQH